MFAPSMEYRAVRADEHPRPAFLSLSGKLQGRGVRVSPRAPMDESGWRKYSEGMRDGPALPRLLTIADLAEMAQLDERTIRRWISRGWLTAVKRGRVVRIVTTDVEKFLLENRVSARAGV
jgi:excisionase family DNA binding protein